MIRARVVCQLRTLAISLGSIAEGAEWHLFGSVDRDEAHAADMDVLILCQSDWQSDALRLRIDQDALELPMHLSLMTFEEAAAVDAVATQRSQVVFP